MHQKLQAIVKGELELATRSNLSKTLVIGAIG